MEEKVNKILKREVNNSMENIFETATRNKLRFEFRGLISVEDLWDLRFEQLDEVYKTLKTEMKKANEESLLKIKTKDQKDVELKIKIVKYIVELKLIIEELNSIINDLE